MRVPQFLIAQGSTPWLELCLPLELTNSTVIYVDICQGRDIVIEYNKNGTTDLDIKGDGTLSIDEDDATVLILSMTQGDTLRLIEGETEIQVRVKTGDGADTLIPVWGMTVPAYKGGTI